MFFSNLKSKKFLLLVTLILFVFSSFSFPLKSRATVPVIDAGNLAANNYGNVILYQIYGNLAGFTPGERQDSIYKEAIYAGLKILLRQLTQSIVNWINSGFEGSPSFITNTGQFLRNTADITVGNFLMNDPALSFLCDPFKIQIKLALGLQYRPFRENIRCTFTGALNNVSNAMRDFTNGNFINGGGWDSWLQMTTVPQNNAMGAMMIAQAELNARLESTTHNAELEAGWGGGFMSWKDCPTQIESLEESFGVASEDTNNRFARYAQATGQQRGKDGCVIKTPGGVIANKINWVDTTTLRELELADDLNEILYALANQLIMKGLGSLQESGLLGGGRQREDTSYQDYMNYLNALDQQQRLQASSSLLLNSSLNPNPNPQNLPATSGSNSLNFEGSSVSSASSIVNSSGSFNNFSDNFATRDIALGTINSQINTENQFFTAQDNIFKLLDATQNVFLSSSCSESVRMEAIEQITGDFTGLKDLLWNKKDVAAAEMVANDNISALNESRNNIISNPESSAVVGLVQSLSVLDSLHSTGSVADYSTGGVSYEQIKTWVVSKVNNNRACVDNISALSPWGIQ
jgi:hypothetical protein